jgi:hypothetical protein
MLNYFLIDHVRQSWAVNLWVTNMMILFRPQIRAHIEARDKIVAAWVLEHEGENVYEDRALEVTTETPISVADQIAAVRKALKRKAD